MQKCIDMVSGIKSRIIWMLLLLHVQEHSVHQCLAKQRSTRTLLHDSILNKNGKQMENICCALGCAFTQQWCLLFLFFSFFFETAPKLEPFENVLQVNRGKMQRYWSIAAVHAHHGCSEKFCTCTRRCESDNKSDGILQRGTTVFSWDSVVLELTVTHKSNATPSSVYTNVRVLLPLLMSIACCLQFPYKNQ